MISRNIAYKLWISDLNGSEYVKSLGEFESNYIKLNNKQISRVNLIATVINKYFSENYSSIIIDDGSSQIQVKSWNENKLLDKAEIGDTVLVIAKIRKENSSDSLFLQPEIVRKVKLEWKIVRANELENEYGKPEVKKIKIENSPELQEIKVSNVALRNKILDIIEKSEEGINKQDIKNNFKNINIDSEIEELIKEGQIFEVKGNYILLK